MDIFDLVAKLTLDTTPYEDGLKGAESDATSIGGKIGGVLGKIGGGVGLAVGAVTTGVTALSGALVDGVTDLATYGDNIDKMSQKMGISAEAYQEWDAVMQHSGTSMETLKASMKTMANAVENNNEAFAQLGITEEQLATMSQEDIFSSVITGLQNMEEGTQRTYIAGQLLGRGATELGALLNTSAEDTQAMKDRVHELGGVLSDEAVKASASFQDQLQDMQTAQQSLSRNMLSDFLPSITTVMGGLTDLFAGDYESGAEQISNGIDNIITTVTDKLPQFMNVGAEIIMNLGNSIVSNAPKILKAGISVMKELAIGLTESLPELIDTASDIITTVLDSLTETLPELLPKLLDAVIQLVGRLLDHLPEILTSLLDLVKALVDSLLKDGLPMLISALPDIIMGVVNFIIGAIPQIITAVIDIVMAIVREFPTIITEIVKALPQIITGVITALLSAIPQLVSAGIQLFISLITALPEITIEIVKAVPEIIKGIVNGFKENAPQIKQAGKDLLTELGNGLKNLGTTISTAVSKIWNAIKDALSSKIESMRDIGRNILQGLIDGITSMASNLWNTVTEIASGVADGFKNFFGIASPSKLFKEYGKFLDEGLAIGIKDNVDLVDNEIDKNFDFSNEIVGFPNTKNNDTINKGVSDAVMNKAIELLTIIANKDLVELSPNENRLYDIVRKKNNEFIDMNGVSGLA